MTQLFTYVNNAGIERIDVRHCYATFYLDSGLIVRAWIANYPYAYLCQGEILIGEEVIFLWESRMPSNAVIDAIREKIRLYLELRVGERLRNCIDLSNCKDI